MNNNNHTLVLKAVEQIPFGVGRKLLTDVLMGVTDNDSIIKNKLDKLDCFGSMAYNRGELNSMIGSLLMNNMLKLTPIEGNKFIKVLALTDKGFDEIKKPTLNNGVFDSPENKKTIINDDDRKMFEAFDFFLEDYNDEQKKAIISPKQDILCIAGAGSGKTSVLTKRIEFLIKFRSVASEKILAVTFTRKAREEMMNRLAKQGFSNVKIETFNSFCEKILKKYNDIVYDKPVKVINYSDKIRILKSALSKLNISMEKAVDKYFSVNQRRGKTNEQLMSIFLNDCFFIRDYFKFKNRPLEDFSYDTTATYVENALMVQKICKFIEGYMEKNGLRDFADQLIDTIKLFKQRNELIPEFDHILIDEYQDVNSTQIELVKLLNGNNMFAVGDPRQSIYGWRGSDIKYILNFEQYHPECEIISLTKNYRSSSHIVELINTSIRHMNLPDLESALNGEKNVKLLNFASEEAEFEFVIQAILASDVPRKEIFVLARTNKQLNELSGLMKQRGIKHVVKQEDIKRDIIIMEDEVTLATIHAIKGMEAETVFVIGCTSLNFPCRGSEHPVVEMVKVDEYDKESEEKRLFYVAMSRAKKSLYLSYSGKSKTSFLTNELISLIDPRHEALNQKTISEYNRNYKEVKSDNNIHSRLLEWRREKSQQLKVPAFLIMHDRTLLEIASKNPMTEQDLNDIYGLGPTKIRKYGEEILEVISG